MRLRARSAATYLALVTSWAFCASGALAAPAPAPAPAPDGAPAGAGIAPPEQNLQAMGFLSRFLDGYIEGYGQPSPGTPAPRRRSMPDALSAPPFPSSSWSLNGTPHIGEPDLAVYPLMGAIYGSGGGVAEAIRQSRVKLLGWTDLSWNISTSSASRGNYPAAYQIVPNTVTLQQVVLRLQREPDTVQKEHIDWGFDVEALYGQDYRWTTMNGIFSNQLRSNSLYGYDVNQFYLDLYLPWPAEGLNVRVGRFISIPDIEANLTVDQPFSSHSFSYTYDPFSQMGAIASLKINRNWWAQLGLVAGDDVAIWAKGATPTVVGCIRWESDDQRDSVIPCINSLGDGKYRTWTDGPTPSSSPLAMPSNNLQAPVVVWGHRFTQQWTMQSEFWFMWMNGAPSYSGGSPTGKSVDFAYEYSLLNFQFWQFSPRDFIGWRNEITADVYGQRTGFNTRLYETTVSWNHWIANGFIGLRPEARFDLALDNGQTP